MGKVKSQPLEPFPSVAHTVSIGCAHHFHRSRTPFPSGAHTISIGRAHHFHQSRTPFPSGAHTISIGRAHHFHQSRTPFPSGAHTISIGRALRFHRVRTPFSRGREAFPTGGEGRRANEARHQARYDGKPARHDVQTHCMRLLYRIRTVPHAYREKAERGRGETGKAPPDARSKLDFLLAPRVFTFRRRYGIVCNP